MMRDNREPWNLLSEARGDISRRIYAVEEYLPIDIPFEELVVEGRIDIYPGHSKYLSVSLKKGGIVVRAGGYVGLVPINDRVAIDIRPRVLISNLDRMLLLSGHPPVALDRFTRYYALGDTSHPSLVHLFARALLAATDEIAQFGLHNEYRQQVETRSFPRGRILLTESYKRHWVRGHSHRVTSQWFEQTTDNDVNRCVKYALWIMGQYYRSLQPVAGSRVLARRLSARYELFQTVFLDHSQSFVSSRYVQHPELLPSIRSYYRDALSVSLAIIQDRSITFDDSGRDVAIPSLMLEMDQIFEKYVREVLRKQFRERSVPIEVLDGNLSGHSGGERPLFHDVDTPKANPDIVLRRPFSVDVPNRHPAICDVKYKDKEPEREDINQAIAYAASYESSKFVIVFARASESTSGLKAIGRIGEVHLFQYGFDLNAEDIRAEETSFAETVGAFVALREDFPESLIGIWD